MTVERKQVIVRLTADELERVDQLASAARLTRNEYMVRTATGDIIDADSVRGQLESFETRLARIEELATLGG